jgi:hypothetical protein
LVSSRLNQHSPHWSPRGNEFVYVREQEIRVRTRDGSSERIVVSRRDFPEITGPLEFLLPAISPDESRVAYTVRGLSKEALYISPIYGGPPAPVLVDSSERQLWASWSPDGAWLTYVSYRAGAGGGLRKVRVGSTEKPVDLAHDPGPPEWSPDGRWILCPDPTGNRGVKLVSEDGKQTRSVGEHLSAATWSRDGKSLYAIRSKDEIRELIAIALETGAIRSIVAIPANIKMLPTRGPVQRLSLSPDSKTILATGYRVDSDIWILDGYEPPRGIWERLWPLKR